MGDGVHGSEGVAEKGDPEDVLLSDGVQAGAGLEKGTGLGYACYKADLSTHASEAEYIPYATDCHDL